MNARHGYGSINFLICLFLALTLHIFAFFIASMHFNEEPDQPRTVPVVTISSAVPQQSASTQSSPAHNVRDVLSTTGASKSTAGYTPEIPPAEPARPRARPSISQQYRQRRPSAGFQALFSKEESESNNPAKQLSTRQSEVLSSYQIMLRQHMLKGELYDRFHRYLQDNDKQRVDYELLLTLFPNGAIKNASISTGSGVEELDKLAITAAFNASPYPAPPADDIRQGFRYRIPFSYLHSD